MSLPVILFASLRPVRHIILFKLRPEFGREVAEKAVELQKDFYQGEGILDLRVEISTDTRKGIIVVRNALFDREGRFEEIRARSEHVFLAKFMSEYFDWWIGAYAE